VEFAFVAVLLNVFFWGPVTEWDFYTPQLLRKEYDVRRNHVGFYINGHEYSVDERARTLKGRLIQYPYASFPCYLDTRASFVKQYMATTGGCLNYLLIDRNGLIVDSGEEMLAPGFTLNEIERSIRKYIDPKGEYTGEPYQKTRSSFIRSIDRKERVRAAISLSGKVVSVDPKNNRMVVDAATKEGRHQIEVVANAETRIEAKNTVVSGLDTFAVGDEIVLLAWGRGFLGPEMELKYQKKGIEGINTATGASVWLGRRIYMPPYAPVFFVKSMKGVESVLASRIVKDYTPLDETEYGKVIHDDKGKKGQRDSYASPASIFVPQYTNHLWLCGKVTKVDVAAGTLSVEQAPLDPDAMHGYRLWKSEKDRMIITSESVKKRLAVLDEWVKRPAKKRNYSFRIDAATAITLNGKYVDSIKIIAVGDSVAVQWPLDQAGSKLLRPDMVRISKPLGK